MMMNCSLPVRTHTDMHICTYVGERTPVNYVCAYSQFIFTKIKTLSVWLGTYTQSVIAALMTFFHTHAGMIGELHSAGSAGFRA